MTDVEGVPLIVGGELFVGAVTAIEKGPNAALALLSLTLIEMFPNVPVVPVGGTPARRPVCVSNDAQAGLFAIAKIRESWSASEAVGTNAYIVPATTDVIGAPEIVGGELVVGGTTAGGTTVMTKAASAMVVFPSLTEIPMSLYVPAFAICGVPCRFPVVVLNAAQVGRLRIVNDNESPS